MVLVRLCLHGNTRVEGWTGTLLPSLFLEPVGLKKRGHELLICHAQGPYERKGADLPAP